MSLSDIIGIALKCIQGIQMLFSAIKAERESRGLIVSCRSLIHSCSLYEETLTLLRRSLKLKERIEFKVDFGTLKCRIEVDIDLLKRIHTESEALLESNKNHYVVTNAFLNSLFGRSNKIKKLESELSMRVQEITMILLKDIYKKSNENELKLFEKVNDPEGCLFWNTYFGTNQTKVTMREFLESYQDYVKRSLLFLPIENDLLQALLLHTLFEENVNSITSQSTITLEMFNNWLLRFGPMKDTLAKCSALIVPESKGSVLWFQKNIQKERASEMLAAKFGKYLQQKNASVSIYPHDFFILRYTSRSSEYQFVVTVYPVVDQLKDKLHIPIVNHKFGYFVSVDLDDRNNSSNDGVKNNEKTYYPNLLQLIQAEVLNKLISPLVSGSVQLNQEHLRAWEEVFVKASSAFQAKYYHNIRSLKQAEMIANAESKLMSHKRPFVSLLPNSVFVADAADEENNVNKDGKATEVDKQNEQQINNLIILAKSKVNDNANRKNDGHTAESNIVDSNNDKKEMNTSKPLKQASFVTSFNQDSLRCGGLLLFEQSLNLLIQCHSITESGKSELMELLKRKMESPIE